MLSRLDIAPALRRSLKRPQFKASFFCPKPSKLAQLARRVIDHQVGDAPADGIALRRILPYFLACQAGHPLDLLRCLRHEARAAMAEQDEALARELSDNLSAAVKLRLRVLRLNKVFMRVLRLRAVDIALERRGQLWPVLSDLDGLLAGSDLLTPFRPDANKYRFHGRYAPFGASGYGIQ